MVNSTTSGLWSNVLLVEFGTIETPSIQEFSTFLVTKDRYVASGHNTLLNRIYNPLVMYS